MNEQGFRSGQFLIDDDCVVFAASDTLAHYILMMYEVNSKDRFADELKEAIDAQTKNSNFIKTVMTLNSVDFEKDVIGKLRNCPTWPFMQRHIMGLQKKGLIGHDDYSLTFM